MLNFYTKCVSFRIYPILIIFVNVLFFMLNFYTKCVSFRIYSIVIIVVNVLFFLVRYFILNALVT